MRRTYARQWPAVGTLLLLMTLLATFCIPATPPRLAAQDNPPPLSIEFVGSIGGTIRTVTVDGNYAYVGEGSALTILDISDPSAPQQVSRLPLTGRLIDIAVSEHLAFVKHDNGVDIVDVSDAPSPIKRGYIRHDSTQGTVAIQEERVYIAGDDLSIYDIQDPSSPVSLGSYSTVVIFDMQVIGNLAYLATQTGLQIVDIEYPADPLLVGSYETSSDATVLQVVNNQVYLFDTENGLVILDVSDPANPSLTGTIEIDSADDMQVTGSLMYLSDGRMFTIYDVSDPSNPVQLGEYRQAGFVQIYTDSRFQIIGNYAYIAYSFQLSILDISDPTSPTLHGSYTAALVESEDVLVVDDRAYVADGSGGLNIIDVADPANPVWKGRRTDYAFAVDVVGSYAYVAGGNGGRLNIIDVSDPTTPRRAGYTSLPGWASGVAVRDNLAYVTGASEGGLQIVDVSDPLSPSVVGSYDTPGNAQDVAPGDGIAYVADGDGGLQIIDVSNPVNPTLLGNFQAENFSFTQIDVQDALAYAAGPFSILDVSDPAKPALKNDPYIHQNPYQDLQVADNLVYVIYSENIVIYDVSDPANPVSKGSYDTPDSAHGLYVDGSLLYVADRYAGLQILRVNDNTSGDSYEVNDTCSQACAISPNGTIQHHLFYEAGDIDWVRFDAADGVTYTIAGTVPDGSPADPVLEIYDACDGSLLKQVDPDTPDLQTTYTATAEGPLFLKLFNHQSSTAGSEVAYDLTVTTAAPAIAVDPATLSSTQQPGTQTNHTLTIENTGSGTLTFDVSSVIETSAWSPLTFPSNKIDIALRQRIQDGGQETFLVYLEQQADLSATYTINDWQERGEYVYETLRTTAQQSQAGLLAFLENQQTAGTVSGYQPYFVTNAVLVEGNTTALDALELRTDTVYIADASDFRLPRPSPAPARSSLSAIEWSLQQIGAHTVWNEYSVRGAGVIVGNIDTGVMSEHPALVNQYRGTADGSHDYNWFDPGSFSPTEPADDNGHGTHTMGTIVGSDGGDHQIGVAPAAQWIAAKGCQGRSCESGSLLAAAQWMLAPYPIGGSPDQGDPAKRPHIINNSWSGYGGQLWYEAAVQAWRAADIFPAFSAGNLGPGTGTLGSPGDYADSFAVGATDGNDAVAQFSARGPSSLTDETKPDITAPGASIRSAVNDGGYTVNSGTSMASPHVAGCAALVRSAAPTLHVADIEYLLTSTAVDLGEAGPDSDYGYGRLDCYAAVSAARATAPSWLTVTPISDTIAPGEQRNLTVMIDSSNMAASTYTGTITIENNTPGNTSVEVPVVLTVGERERIPTGAVEQGTITPDDGGTVSDGIVWARFPPNATDNDLTIIYTALQQPSNPLDTEQQGVRLFTLKAVRADGQEVTNFPRTFELAVRYTAAELDALGVSADDLHLIAWDADAGRWRTIPSSVDTTNQQVTGVFDRTGEFALVAGAIASHTEAAVYLPLVRR